MIVTMVFLFIACVIMHFRISYLSHRIEQLENEQLDAFMNIESRLTSKVLQSIRSGRRIH